MNAHKPILTLSLLVLLVPAVLVTVGFFVSVSPAHAEPKIQVIKLFDENLFEASEPGLTDPFIKKSTSVSIVLGEQDVAILSSTSDGTGIPNVDDFITINGQFVQGGFLIPLAVFFATGNMIDNTACNFGVSVNRCAFPRPHHQPVDVSDVIPVGSSTVTVDIWDYGGGFGHTDLYLVIIPRPLNIEVIEIK